MMVEAGGKDLGDSRDLGINLAQWGLIPKSEQKVAALQPRCVHVCSEVTTLLSRTITQVS